MSNVSPSKRRSKQQAENWDDDFEFSLPPQKRSNSVSKSGDQASEDGWDENWDESPPKALPAVDGSLQESPTRHGLSYSRGNSKVPSPLSIPITPYSQPSANDALDPGYLPLPSPSPIPLGSSPNLHRPLLSERSNSSLSSGKEHKPRSRAGSLAVDNGGTVRKKLIKRHPSASFVPILGSRSSGHLPITSGSSASLASAITQPAASSIRKTDMRPVPSELPRSTSGEQMPPPPVPIRGEGGLLRSKSKSRRQGLPSSPVKQDDRAKEQKQGFWKKMSGGPSERDTSQSHRRRRSSSVGATLTNSPLYQQAPPIPPLPANLRSPSAASAASSTSTSSQHSQRPHGMASAIQSLLRRSSSSLSKHSKESITPPSAYSYAYLGEGSKSKSSIVGIPIPGSTSRDGRTTPDQPSSLSRGFHLPSPSPGSPYHSKMRIPAIFDQPPLPQSSSLPSLGIGLPTRRSSTRTKQKSKENDSDSDIEGDQTPRRRKRLPLASLRPTPEKHWQGERFDVQRPLESASIPGLPRSSTLGAWPDTGSPGKSKVKPTPLIPAEGESGSISSGHTGASGSGFASTVRRLGSLSKKHGRRLSGGWKFNTQSSSSSSNSGAGVNISAGSVFGQPREERGSQLETVMGSPVKERNGQVDREDDQTDSPVVVDHPPEVQRPLPKRNHRPRPSDQWDQDFPPSPATTDKLDQVERSAALEKALLAEIEKKKRDDKHKRRQSWNDFVIPRNVMEKQKGVKAGIGAVKQFAVGVDSLKTLLSIHSTLCDQINAAGSPADTSMFDALEAEFAQWWEMAVVLIEVGSTGKDSGSVASVESPKRERRITLASDEARSASEVLRQVSSSSTASFNEPPSTFVTSAQILSAARKISLPDPDGSSTFSGPPRASPEQWRASTGRQDLSKRQLEVLRTMLRTPVSTSNGSVSGSVERPVITRGATASSARSEGSQLADRFEQRRQEMVDEPGICVTEMSPGRHPLRINTSSPLGLGVDQTPSTAKVKDRRMSKAGLAGLKEFLRSLKKEKSEISGGGEKKSTPRRVKSYSKVRHEAAAPGASWTDLRSNLPPPSSPSSPIASPGGWSPYPQSLASGVSSSARDQYQSSRSSFSALRPEQPSIATQSPLPASGISGSAQSQTSSRVSWQFPPSSSPAASSQPAGQGAKRPSIRNIFRTNSGNWSDLVQNGPPASVGSSQNGSPGLRKRGSVQVLGQISEKMGMSKEKEAAKQKERERVQELTMGSLTGRVPGVARGSISVSDPLPHTHRVSAAVNEMGARPKGGAVEGDMTLKPRRKSRGMALDLGLGWPERKLEGEMRSPTLPNMGGGGGGGGRPHAASNATLSSSMTAAGETEDEGEIVVALTPENLPTLLEYLRQCETRLGEWQEKITNEGLDRKVLTRTLPGE